MQKDLIKYIKSNMDTSYFGGNHFYVRDEFGTGVILVSKAIKYLSDYMIFKDKEVIFKKSFSGAKKLKQYDLALDLCDTIKGLDKDSIIACCKLCSFDLIHEIGVPWYKQVDKINPSDQVIYNVEGMAKRTIEFLQDKIILERDIKIDNSIGDKKIYGHVDYIADDSIWNIKVISGKPAKNDIGNLLYCLESLNDKSLTKIGIYNPRHNVAYTYDLGSI